MALNLDGTSRLLVIAPHPDDETLATGGLLQQAREQGAQISVLMLTLGDNNPWPQRWLERRWRLDAKARRRWGERRLREARLALDRLGVDVQVLVSPAWPDMGLTAEMLRDCERLRARLRSHVRTFAPNLVVMPALTDAHPDHSAAHLLTRTALRQCKSDARCVAYLVHGRKAHDANEVLRLDEHQLARKRHALQAHQSQMAMSGGRLLRMVTAQEAFADVHEKPSPTARKHVPAWIDRIVRPGFEVLLHTDERVWAVPVPWSAGHQELVRRLDGSTDPAYFKLRWRGRSPYIFDHWGWQPLPLQRAPLDP